ncbi:MAG: hypothetical protein IBX69_18175, partial [Anaerolineales bacterium]|nr:hypothetical protein [Anaerolineales bacterium]
LLIVLLAYVVYLRSVAKMDVERYTKEMKTQRDLIDKTETAHFTDQREYLGEELRKIANRDNEFRKDVLAKFDKLERELRQALRKQETETAINEREEFKQKLSMQLEEWKTEVNALKIKAADVEGEAKGEIDQQVHELEVKIEEAEAKLAELAEVGEDAWDSVKKRVESSWDALRTAFNDAAAKIKD